MDINHWMLHYAYDKLIKGTTVFYVTNLNTTVVLCLSGVVAKKIFTGWWYQMGGAGVSPRLLANANGC